MHAEILESITVCKRKLETRNENHLHSTAGLSLTAASFADKLELSLILRLGTGTEN